MPIENNSQVLANGSSISGYKFATRAVHAGFEADGTTGAVIPPISTSSTFLFKDGTIQSDYIYSRLENPNRDAFERSIASLEQANYGLAFASGMAASMAVLHLLKSGDHIVRTDDLYSATQNYMEKSLVHLGISTSSFSKIEELNSKIQEEKTKIVWIESPTNPTLKITDIAEVSKIAHAHDCLLLVDNTFMSPFSQQPLKLGADIVLHSVSKYINGHTDVVMGVLCFNDDKLRKDLKYLQETLGGTPSPFDCYLASRGVRTLALRMKQHEENAMRVAQYLETHRQIRLVLYPGLSSHPQHQIAKKQTSCYGGMITFYLNGGMAAATAFMRSCKLMRAAVSLGAVETLVEHPASMTHKMLSTETRAQLGINDSLIRLSVGIEDADDIIQDMHQALDAATAAQVETK